MSKDLIPLTFNKIMQSSSYTVFILHGDNKRFAIYADPKVGQNIQTVMTDNIKLRPYTHDLLNFIFQGLSIKVLQTVIYDVKDTIYYAKLFVEQVIDGKKHILEMDARPSDCLTLSLMNNTPILCKKEAWDKIIDIQD